MKLKGFFQVLGIIAVVFTLIPFVAMDYWWIRIFDYPHVQLTAFTLVTFFLYFVRFDIRSWRDYCFVAILGGCFVFQLLKIYPYTPFAAFEVQKNENTSPASTLSLLVANVLQKNTQTKSLLDEILVYDPDVLILTETDLRWQKKLNSGLDQRYPYRVLMPLDNTYGMMMYSRYPLINPEIKFLVSDSIPSIHTRMRLPSGKIVKIYAIHPTPPVPMENPKSTERDAEMMIVAKMAKNDEFPVIVTGDFNDVAWSETTSLFQDVSGLLDPRIGRGFFNTYNANSFIMRWPLDHLFISREWRLVDMERGSDFGSDHFPIYFKLSLEPENAQEQEKKKPSTEEKKEANKAIEAAK